MGPALTLPGVFTNSFSRTTILPPTWCYALAHAHSHIHSHPTPSQVEFNGVVGQSSVVTLKGRKASELKVDLMQEVMIPGDVFYNVIANASPEPPAIERHAFVLLQHVALPLWCQLL